MEKGLQNKVNEGSSDELLSRQAVEVEEAATRIFGKSGLDRSEVDVSEAPERPGIFESFTYDSVKPPSPPKPICKDYSSAKLPTPPSSINKPRHSQLIPDQDSTVNYNLPIGIQHLESLLAF